MLSFSGHKLKTALAMQVLFLNLNAQSVITTIAGNGTQGFAGDNGNALSCEFNNITTLYVDSSYNIIVTDAGNYRIRRIDNTGIINTIAGTGTAGFSGDNGNALLAQINVPEGVLYDNNGNLCFGDLQNNRIRKVNVSGIISTIAGTGVSGYTGDNGQAVSAEIKNPLDITRDDTGNIYIADYNNTIRKINSSGIITTIAGTGAAGYSVNNGPAISAMLNYPRGIRFDKKGNLYISDALNYRIRKINLAGIITTIAGNGTSGYSGDGGPATSAKLNSPGELAIDDAGNIFFTDEWNNVVRKIDTNGIITTVVGNGTAGFNGDNGPPLLANLNVPFALAMDKQGNLYIGDTGNNRIRKITNVGNMGTIQVANNDIRIALYPNPTKGIFSLQSTKEFNPLSISNTLGKIILQQKTKEKNVSIDLSQQPPGIYFLHTQGQVLKIVKE